MHNRPYIVSKIHLSRNVILAIYVDDILVTASDIKGFLVSRLICTSTLIFEIWAFKSILFLS